MTSSLLNSKELKIDWPSFAAVTARVLLVSKSKTVIVAGSLVVKLRLTV